LFLSNFVKGRLVPGTPSCPIIQKVVGREVTVAWTKPNNHGGAKISGHRIAYATPGSDTADYVIVKAVTTASISKNLRVGETYVFAVAAKNSVGHGEFSGISESITISDDTGKYLFVSAVALHLFIFTARSLAKRGIAKASCPFVRPSVCL